MNRRTIYAYLGWLKLEGRWLYLHAGGVIRAHGLTRDVETAPPDALTRFELPDPPAGADGWKQSVPASECWTGWRRIESPSRCWRPSIAPRSAAPFFHLAGRPTGNYKTEIAALAQQHYGAGLEARNLPGRAGRVRATRSRPWRLQRKIRFRGGRLCTDGHDRRHAAFPTGRPTASCVLRATTPGAYGIAPIPRCTLQAAARADPFHRGRRAARPVTAVAHVRSRSLRRRRADGSVDRVPAGRRNRSIRASPVGISSMARATLRRHFRAAAPGGG